MSNIKTKDTRARNFATIVYPESAPEDWLDILGSLHIPCFISPLHEDDILPDGSKKKPHYHVMLMFDGKKSVEQVQEIWDLIGGVGFQNVISMRAYARYLCHLDNPEKAQYSSDKVISIAADYDSVIGLVSDKYKAVMEMIEFCKDNEIYSYAELLEWCSVHKYDWFKSLCDNTSYVIREYLKSRTWDLKESLSETGVNTNE